MTSEESKQSLRRKDVGGLFADLPETGVTDEAILEKFQQQHQRKDEEKAAAENPTESSKANSISAMSFIPSVARKRKFPAGAAKYSSARSSSGVTPNPPASTDTSVSNSPTGKDKSPPSSFPSISQAVKETDIESQSNNDSTKRRAEEELRETATGDNSFAVSPALEIEDPYDPFLPNDLLQYRTQLALEREKERLDQERRIAIEAQERLRKKLDQERKQLELQGDLDSVVRHREESSKMMGRGRGVSNLPAWLLKKQRDG